MKTIKQYYNKVKMNYYREMAIRSLDKAHDHLKEDEFWIWMKLFRKYSNKYFELIGKLEL